MTSYKLPHVHTFTIAESAAVSDVLHLAQFQKRPRGVDFQIPAEWTAADLGVQVSDDGTTWIPHQLADGTIPQLTSLPTAQAVNREGVELAGIGAWNFMRLASLDTADGTAENQAAARTIKARFYE